MNLTLKLFLKKKYYNFMIDYRNEKRDFQYISQIKIAIAFTIIRGLLFLGTGGGGFKLISLEYRVNFLFSSRTFSDCDGPITVKHYRIVCNSAMDLKKNIRLPRYSRGVVCRFSFFSTGFTRTCRDKKSRFDVFFSFLS